MKRKMGKRVMVTLMAMMLLMVTSVTAFAVSKDGTNVKGTLVKTSTTEAKADTSLLPGKDPDLYTYVYVKVHYTTASNETIWSNKEEGRAPRGSVARKKIVGRLNGAESGHGIRPTEIEFNLRL